MCVCVTRAAFYLSVRLSGAERIAWSLQLQRTLSGPWTQLGISLPRLFLCSPFFESCGHFLALVSVLNVAREAIEGFPDQICIASSNCIEGHRFFYNI